MCILSFDKNFILPYFGTFINYFTEKIGRKTRIFLLEETK